jgi:diacylglycerol kinase
MTTICKKAAQDFHRAVSKVFDRVKSVALWSANIRKLAKDHKDYGSAASVKSVLFLYIKMVSFSWFYFGKYLK